jgi:hypothetical protein
VFRSEVILVCGLYKKSIKKQNLLWFIAISFRTALYFVEITLPTQLELELDD